MSTIWDRGRTGVRRRIRYRYSLPSFPRFHTAQGDPTGSATLWRYRLVPVMSWRAAELLWWWSAPGEERLLSEGPPSLLELEP